MTQLIVSVLIWNSGAPTKMRSCIACGDNVVCFAKDACWVSCGFEIIYFERNKKAFFSQAWKRTKSKWWVFIDS